MLDTTDLINIHHALLAALIFGAYGWTTLIYSWLRDDLKDLRENHLNHLNQEIESLNNKLRDVEEKLNG